MAQSIFTIIIPVVQGAAGELKSTLESFGYLGTAPKDDPLGFTDLDTLHYASVFMYDDLDGWSVVFEFNIDGSIHDYLNLLATSVTEQTDSALDKVLTFCQGYSNSSQHIVVEFLKRHTQMPSAKYCGSVGRSRDQILFEAKLHAHVSQMLDDLPDGCDGPTASKVIRDSLDNHADLKAYKDIPDNTPNGEQLLTAQSKENQPENEPGKLANGLVFLKRFIAALRIARRRAGWQPVFKGLLAFFTFLLLGIWNQLRNEPSAQEDTFTPDGDQVLEQKSKEDFIGTNHMVSVVHTYDDFARKWAKWSAFEILDLLSTYLFDKGKLGSIPTIHYAHWAMINNDRRLLFVSNFDGSWDSYLDDFTLKAASGLTLAWAHGIGFPRSIFMFLGGAAKGPEFIDWARRSMVPNLVWYKAYPQLSVSNINLNTALRQAIANDVNGNNSGNWLELIQ